MELMDELEQLIAALVMRQADAGLSPSQQGNFLQDLFSLTEEPLLQGVQPGGVDPSAFAEVPDGYDEFDVKSRATLDAYLASGDETDPYFMLAEAIDGGLNPQSATAQIAEALQLDKDAAEDLQSTATDMFKEKVEHDESIRTLPEGGELVGGKYRVAKFKPSKAAEEYRDLGLPLPHDRWQTSDLDGPTRYGQNIGEAQERADTATSAFDAQEVAFQNLLKQATQTNPEQSLVRTGPREPVNSTAEPSPVTQVFLDDLLAEASPNALARSTENPIQDFMVASGQGDPKPDFEAKILEALTGLSPQAGQVSDALGATPLSQGAGTNPFRQRQSRDVQSDSANRLEEARQGRSTALRDKILAKSDSVLQQNVARKRAERRNETGRSPLEQTMFQRLLGLRGLGLG